MDFDRFKASLLEERPPAGLERALRALWADGKGDWDGAHEIAQDGDDRDSAWVHAYLHRKEGDLSNAKYWYRHAGRSVSRLASQEEWAEIAAALL